MPSERLDVFLAVLRAHADAAQMERLEAALPRAGAPFERGRFFGAYAGAGRRFPGALDPSADEAARLHAAGVVDPAAWSTSDLARSALLVAACGATEAAEHLSITREAFRKGDNEERIALLRTLALLPAPERFVELATEACRSHVDDVFAALACENPFPASHLPDSAFRQVVLKALFLEIPIERILRWRDRNDRELRRMTADYAAERRAAGRKVPDDIALIDSEAL